MTKVTKSAPVAPKRARAKAVDNPKAAFDHPLDVVHAPGLPAADKQAALETWEEDERALQRATDEGMAGGERPRLREVKQAERALEEKAGKAKPSG